MPKLKSHRGAKKRLRLTGTGQIKRSKAGGSHILTKKSRKRKRNLKHSVLVVASEFKKMKRCLPYG